MVLWRINSPQSAEDETNLSYGVPNRTRSLFPIPCIYCPVYLLNFKYEAQTALFKDPVRTTQ